MSILKKQIGATRGFELIIFLIIFMAISCWGFYINSVYHHRKVAIEIVKEERKDNQEPSLYTKAANLSENQPDIKPIPGLWVATRPMGVFLPHDYIESQILINNDGTFRLTIQLYEKVGTKNVTYFSEVGDGQYKVKGSTLIFSEIPNIQSWFFKGNREIVTSWDDNQLVTDSVITKPEIYIHKNNSL